MIKPSELVLYKQGYNAHIRNLDDIIACPRKRPSRPRAPPASTSAISRSTSQPSLVASQLRNLASDKSSFYLPRIYKQIRSRNSKVALIRREMSRQEEHSYNIGMYGRIYSQKSALRARLLQPPKARKGRPSMTATVTLRPETEVQVFATKLLPISSKYFQVSISIRRLQVPWPSMEQLRCRLGLLLVNQTHSSRAKLKHTRKTIVGDKVTNEFTNSCKLLPEELPSRVLIYSQIVTTEQIQTAVFQFRGGNANLTSQSELAFVVLAVERDRQNDLFYFAVKGAEDQQLDVLNNRGKVVGKIEYDYRARVNTRGGKKRESLLSGITENDRESSDEAQ